MIFLSIASRSKICSSFGIGYFWPIVLALSWGVVVALHGVFVITVLSDSCPIVSDEYNRLKSLTIKTAKDEWRNFKC